MPGAFRPGRFCSKPARRMRRYTGALAAGRTAYGRSEEAVAAMKKRFDFSSAEPGWIWSCEAAGKARRARQQFPLPWRKISCCEKVLDALRIFPRISGGTIRPIREVSKHIYFHNVGRRRHSHCLLWGKAGLKRAFRAGIHHPFGAEGNPFVALIARAIPEGLWRTNSSGTARSVYGGQRAQFGKMDLALEERFFFLSG